MVHFFRDNVLFCIENAKFWLSLTNLGYFVANLRTFWCTHSHSLTLTLTFSFWHLDSWSNFTSWHLSLVMFWWQTVLVWNVNPKINISTSRPLNPWQEKYSPKMRWLFTGLTNVAVYQNWQLWGMVNIQIRGSRLKWRCFSCGTLDIFVWRLFVFVLGCFMIKSGNLEFLMI